MSDKDNTMIVLALAAGVYMLTRRGQGGAVATAPVRGTVPSMPGSAGAGWQQIAAGALTGFLQSAASGVLNGAQAYTPSLANASQAATDWAQAGTVQDVADGSDLYSDWA